MATITKTGARRPIAKGTPTSSTYFPNDPDLYEFRIRLFAGALESGAERYATMSLSRHEAKALAVALARSLAPAGDDGLADRRTKAAVLRALADAIEG